jgi:hypothetical protein
MVKNNHCELNKCTLNRWVDKVLKQAHTKTNTIDFDNVVDEDQWGEMELLHNYCILQHLKRCWNKT